MLRKKLKTFATYQEASEFKASFAEVDILQIRRKRKGFDVVERIEGKVPERMLDTTYHIRRRARRRQREQI